MKPIAIVILGLAVFAMATTHTYAQSGSRGGGGAAPSSGGGSTGGGGGASGSGTSSGGVDGTFSQNGSLSSRFREADILSGQADVIRSIGEANYNAALSSKEYESARQLYIESQIVVAQARQAARDRKEAIKAERRAERKARVAQERLKNEVDHAMRVANASSIQWPTTLQKNKYSKYRIEIEQLARLYADLEHNAGIKVGLDTAIQSLAEEVAEAEQDGLIKGDTRETVRTFVADLSKNYGQFPTENQFMKKEMLAGM